MKFGSASLIAFGLLLCALSPTSACETPVYRYAMYRWQPSPYELYCFHDGKPPESLASINEELAKLKLTELESLNVTPIGVNMADPEELERIPPGVLAAWKGESEKGEPGYLLLNPKGIPVYQGTLDQDAFKKLAHSPYRKQIATELADGKLGILVFVEGKNKEESATAEKLTAELVKAVNSGEKKVTPGVLPGAELLSPEAKADEEAGADKPSQVGFIRMTRNQPGEEWLWRMLEAVEPDLHEFDEPMVFMLFGRGRALEPYIGAGITSENLMRDLVFVSGPCSCTVKDQNPGVDLLMQNDWEAAAEKLTELFGAEEGNEEAGGGDEFFPELLLPGAGELVSRSNEKPDDETGDEPRNEDPTTDQPAGNVQETESQNDPESGTTSTAVTEPSDQEPVDKQSAETNPTPESQISETTPKNESSETAEQNSGKAKDDSAETVAARDVPKYKPRASDAEVTESGTLVTYIVVGFGVAIVGLFAATFFILRPRN